MPSKTITSRVSTTSPWKTLPRHPKVTVARYPLCSSSFYSRLLQKSPHRVYDSLSGFLLGMGSMEVTYRRRSIRRRPWNLPAPRCRPRRLRTAIRYQPQFDPGCGGPHEDRLQGLAVLLPHLKKISHRDIIVKAAGAQICSTHLNTRSGTHPKPRDTGLGFPMAGAPLCNPSPDRLPRQQRVTHP